MMPNSKKKSHIQEPYSNAHFVELLTNGSFSFLNSSLKWIFWNATPEYINYFGLPSINEVLLFILIFEIRADLTPQEKEELIILCTDYTN